MTPTFFFYTFHPDQVVFGGFRVNTFYFRIKKEKRVVIVEYSFQFQILNNLTTHLNGEIQQIETETPQYSEGEVQLQYVPTQRCQAKPVISSSVSLGSLVNIVGDDRMWLLVTNYCFGQTKVKSRLSLLGQGRKRMTVNSIWLSLRWYVFPRPPREVRQTRVK